MRTKPLLEIDWFKVDELLLCGCTGVEIAGFFGMHEDTLYKRCENEFSMGFSAYAQQKRSKGDALLRAKQYEKAMGGDNMMLVWLGKNRLKQRDTPQEIELSPETAKNFTDIMGQLSSLQRNKEENNNNTDNIS